MMVFSAQLGEDGGLHSLPLSLYSIYPLNSSCIASSTEFLEVEMRQGRVSALSARAYTATLYVMVNKVKEGGLAPLTLTILG
jgi:hypothetical protein